MKISRNEFFAVCLIAAAAMFFAHHQARAEVLFVPTDVKARVAARESFTPNATRIMPWRPIRPPMPSDLPFRVTKSRVDVRIEENVASTTIEQSFLNLSGRDLEVRVMIPLPKGAAINRSALSMNDEMVQGKLYNAEEAHRIYQSIVSQRRDPALLRFVGENLYEARVFPIPPNQERRLKFSYDHVLKPIGGLYDFRHILSGSQLYQSGLEKFKFECVIRSKRSIGPVYSPSHTVAVERPNERTAIVKLTDSNLSTDRDFRLYYAPSSEDVSLRLVTHRASPGEDGYFMLIGRPDDQFQKGRVLPKEVVFVLDTSGSMAGEKIEQACNALRFCLNQLNPRDRFNLVTFSTEVRALNPGKLLVATKENVKKAVAAVDTIEATGGTDIDGALREALRNDFSEGRANAKLVIFLTDGLPSVGITDAHQILKDVSNFNNKHRARVFSFGVGTDVNTHLLDRIAVDYDGSSSYVAPKEDLELKVSDFYARIKNPVMTDLAFDFGSGVRAHSMYPRKVPALFKGAEVLLFGRYKGTGPSTVTLRGNVAGAERMIPVSARWPSQERDNTFLPRVWAMRKIGHLLESIRLRGPNKETIDEVVKLSKRHGIVTPYTSQLVLEPGMRPPGPGGWGRRNMDRRDQVRAMREGMRRAISKGGRMAPRAALAPTEDEEREAKEEALGVAQHATKRKSGDFAVGLAAAEKALKDARDVSEPAKPAVGKMDKNAEAAKSLRSKAFLGGKASQGWGGRGGGAVDADMVADALAVARELTVKHVGERTFYLRSGVWVDSSFKTDKKAKPSTVTAFSEEYFDLLKKHPALGGVLSLGNNIVVVIDGKAYRIMPADSGKK